MLPHHPPRLPSPRLAVMAAALAALAGCSGSDATAPANQQPEDAWVRATITLLDSGPPCNPGIACPAEMFTCDGTTPIFGLTPTLGLCL